MSARDLLIEAMVQAGWTERMATQLVASVRVEAVTDWKKEAGLLRAGPPFLASNCRTWSWRRLPGSRTAR